MDALTIAAESYFYYKGYHGEFEWDADACVWYGRVTNIFDTITFQSPYRHHLQWEFETSVEMYLQCFQHRTKLQQ